MSSREEQMVPFGQNSDNKRTNYTFAVISSHPSEVRAQASISHGSLVSALHWSTYTLGSSSSQQHNEL